MVIPVHKRHMEIRLTTMVKERGKINRRAKVELERGKGKKIKIMLSLQSGIGSSQATWGEKRKRYITLQSGAKAGF